MRKIKFAQASDCISFTQTNGSCCPFSDTVNSYDCRFLKRRRVKSTGRMREVMFGENYFCFGWPYCGQFLIKHFTHEKFFLDPDRHGRKKTFQSLRSES